MGTVVVPGAFTAPGSFARFADTLGPLTRVVTLPARSRRVPQLDRGGLAAADRTVDAELAVAGEDGGPVILVGHSLGGLLALRASRRTPVDALVLLVPAPPSGLAPDLARTALRDPASVAKLGVLSLSSALVRLLPSGPPRGLFSAEVASDVLADSQQWRVDESWLVLAQLAFGSRETVEPSPVPTLVVAGRDDGLVPAATVRRLADDLRADFAELPVAHNFSEEPAGDVVGERVVRWLAAREQPATSDQHA